TVQRWEKREGMPVHRHVHDRKGSVSASRAELDAWTRSRNLPPIDATEEPAASAVPPTDLRRAARRWTAPVIALAALGLVAASAMIYMQRTELVWRDPLAGARFQNVTDWEGVEE